MCTVRQSFQNEKLPKQNNAAEEGASAVLIIIIKTDDGYLAGGINCVSNNNIEVFVLAALWRSGITAWYSGEP